MDSRGGELAGGSDGRGHQPSSKFDSASDDFEETPHKQVVQKRESFEDLDEGNDTEISRLTNAVFAVFSYLSVFLIGGFLAWFLFHKTVYVAVDPYTGKVMGVIQELPPERSTPADPAQAQPAQPQTQPQPSKPQRDDGHKQ
jgi:hypothetical protein